MSNALQCLFRLVSESSRVPPGASDSHQMVECLKIRDGENRKKKHAITQFNTVLSRILAHELICGGAPKFGFWHMSL